MKRVLVILFSLLLTSLTALTPSFMRQPAMSPDGETICFVYMSDLWTVPYMGGEAKRLTVSEGEDFTPIYSPDGKWIAFLSIRDGFRGVYLIPAEGGKAKLITKETYVSISDWYPDGKRLLGTRFQRGTGTGQYEINIDGRRVTEIMPITHQFSKLSPKQDKILFCRRGDAYRPAYEGSTAGDLWEYDIKKKKYTQHTFTDTTERYPVYSHVNPYIYYGGSDGERFQLFRVKNYDFDNREQLTFFDEFSLRCLSIARHNDRMAFERFNRLWRYDPEKGKAEEIEIVILQDFLGDYNVKENYMNVVEEFSVSPDGKLVAFSYKYDLFAMPEKGGEVKRITYDQKEIRDIVILHDNKTIYFTKRDKGSFQLFSVDINKPDNIVKNLWTEDKYIRHIYLISPRYLAIHYKIDEDYWRVALLDVNTNEITEVIENSPVWAWFLSFTPNLDYSFYTTGEVRVGSRQLHLYDIKKKKSKNLFSSLNYIGGIYLGLDNESLFFTLGSDLVRLDLIPKPDFRKTTDNWDDILEAKKNEVKINYPDKKGKKDEKPQFKIDYEGLETRITPIANHPGTNMIVHMISDSTFYYVNRNGNRFNLRSMNYWGENDKDITTLSGSISGWTTGFKYNEENKHFYVVVDKQLLKVNPASGKFEVVKNEFEYEYNEIELNKSVFDEIWIEFGNNFYDPNMHGRDWNQMYERFKPYVSETYKIEYLSYIVSEMIGELNASHTGFYPRSDDVGGGYELAFFGGTLDYGTTLREGIKFRDLYLGSTLYQKHKIRNGDVLLSVDGEKITPKTTISSLFIDKVGKKINLKIETSSGTKDVIIRGLSVYEDYDLYYEDLINERKNLVEKLSKGRIGYIHIPRMKQEEVSIFLNNLFARNYTKDAVIIDVRGNSGGRISRQLLDILSRESRAYTTSRGYPDQMFETPNHIWDKPKVLLIDQNSFSDAEIFPILFRQKGLGKVIGMPTGGGIIGTVPYTLMDGSTIRMPRQGWYTKEGENMEGTGARPDIFIDRSPEDIIKKNDTQIEEAVKELLEQLKN